MESIYWVMAWACHRKCRHCYEDRFRPYVRGALEAVLAEAERNAPRIIANLPPEMTYLDMTDPGEGGTLPRKTGRIILSGGESLMDPVRERVTYPVIEQLVAKYRDVGGVKIVVQTTGDLLTPAIVDDLLRRGIWMISVASIDDYHVGLEGEAKQKAFIAKLTGMFEAAGMRQSGIASTSRKWLDEAGPLYSRMRGLARSGRAGVAGRTGSPPRRSPTISAPAGQARRTSSTTAIRGRR
ncbi:MAG: radical SAM protein [Acetobacteraceae bacterium]|nr:radical SAM protein [Acetobacteraceae bacterium]